ncbi:poly-gamma-glutamate biosynthesis protein PgsC/CapC [Planotetraspora sp. A-T 1434]|uniref:poly-gamma-glutamate biosynthesis protein PgsC/CapC n=1 Tax=unclassified Planotetraspora TaxID=2620298 RepID=UPI0021BFFF27|nr:poly-gamma-glutamate biosynthesis protein PgsC/CapC [Planotetraspora sp. A-T 1434]MCT9935328.1 poly-gamma-glutamate biosynthesis protein PgsC/CapC [Planotetraspora sp. A-T 1434]
MIPSLPTDLPAEAATLGLAIGLLFGLCCYLLTNLSPGGMITPAWLAITLLEDWRRIAMIIAITVLTWGGAVAARKVIILYGKRLFAGVVMLGVLLQMTLSLFLIREHPLLFGYQTLGFIVPGLIAYQFLRQPVVATATAALTVTGLTYAVLVGGLLLFLPW